MEQDGNEIITSSVMDAFQKFINKLASLLLPKPFCYRFCQLEHCLYLKKVKMKFGMSQYPNVEVQMSFAKLEMLK